MDLIKWIKRAGHSEDSSGSSENMDIIGSFLCLLRLETVRRPDGIFEYSLGDIYSKQCCHERPKLGGTPECAMVSVHLSLRTP